MDRSPRILSGMHIQVGKCTVLRCFNVIEFAKLVNQTKNRGPNNFFGSSPTHFQCKLYGDCGVFLGEIDLFFHDMRVLYIKFLVLLVMSRKFFGTTGWQAFEQFGS